MKPDEQRLGTKHTRGELGLGTRTGGIGGSGGIGTEALGGKRGEQTQRELLGLWNSTARESWAFGTLNSTRERKRVGNTSTLRVGPALTATFTAPAWSAASPDPMVTVPVWLAAPVTIPMSPLRPPTASAVTIDIAPLVDVVLGPLLRTTAPPVDLVDRPPVIATRPPTPSFAAPPVIATTPPSPTPPCACMPCPAPPAIATGARERGKGSVAQ